MGPLTAPPTEAFANETRDRYLIEKRAALLRALPDRADPMLGFLNPAGETRTREGFKKEVEAWVQRATRGWPVLALVQFIEKRPQALRFAVVNNSEENFEAVQLEVTLPFQAGLVFESVADARAKAKTFRPPAPWGRQREHLMSTLVPEGLSIGGPDIVAVDEDHAVVSFTPFHVRPKSRHDAGGISLALMPQTGGKEFAGAVARDLHRDQRRFVRDHDVLGRTLQGRMRLSGPRSRT